MKTIHSIMINILACFVVFLFGTNSVSAQNKVQIPLQYKDYLDLVNKHNLNYAIEKLNVDVADAQITAGKIFQNPFISFGGDRDNSSGELGLTYSTEIGQTIELGGKRRARIDLAKSRKLLTEFLLADFYRNLRADATIEYFNALKLKSLLDVSFDSYKTMHDLAIGDSIRFALGSITEIDAVQSSIEAGVLYNNYLGNVADQNISILALASLIGKFLSDTVYLPQGTLNNLSRNFVLEDLISNALNNRSDLQAALQDKDVARKTLISIKRDRFVDLDLSIGTSQSYSGFATAPNSKGISAGIAIPLKFSNINKGELKIAQFQMQQSDLAYQKAELKIRIEVMQKYHHYLSTLSQLKTYENGLLEQAKIVLDGKIYSYSRGETSLLEVLNAQHTFNEIRISYYETKCNCAVALVELEKAAGVWDIIE